MTDFEKQVLEDLAELKTNMRWVAGGDSQPGRLHEIAQQVDQHEQFLQRARGWSAAMACLLTIAHLAIDYLRMHIGR